MVRVMSYSDQVKIFYNAMKEPLFYHVLNILKSRGSYSDNQKLKNRKTTIKVFKENSSNSKLLNHLLSEMGLFTLYNCFASCKLDTI